MNVDPPTAPPAARLSFVDALRGVAVLAMVAYHFSWDLRYFGFIAADVERDLFWIVFARSIASTFLFIVGVSLVLSMRRGFDRERFLRRLGIVAGAAAAVTIATWFLFRDSFIFFGILHHIVVASVLGLPFVWAPVWVTALATVFAFAAPAYLSGPAFDHAPLLWVGFSTTLPRSNDFVPLFPWFGVVLAGIIATRLCLAYPSLIPGVLRERPLTKMGAAGNTLLWIGRHSLVIYLLHQPILFGLTDLASRINPPDLLNFEPAYVETCVASCVESEVEEATCRQTCGCIASRAQAEGLWTHLMRQTLTEDEETRYFAFVDTCRAAAGVP